MFSRNDMFVMKDGELYDGPYRINKVIKLKDSTLLYQILPNYLLFTEKDFLNKFILVDSVAEIQPS